jgi:hypothetical protein
LHEAFKRATSCSAITNLYANLGVASAVHRDQDPSVGTRCDASAKCAAL